MGFITYQKRNPIERKNLIKAIEESSPVRWHHINLHGTFDFSKEALHNALEFDIEELINFETFVAVAAKQLILTQMTDNQFIIPVSCNFTP